MISAEGASRSVSAAVRRLRGAVDRLPGIARFVVLIVVVGTLIEFLPLDLAIVAASVALFHLSLSVRIGWVWLRGVARRWLV